MTVKQFDFEHQQNDSVIQGSAMWFGTLNILLNFVFILDRWFASEIKRPQFWVSGIQSDHHYFYKGLIKVSVIDWIPKTNPVATDDALARIFDFGINISTSVLVATVELLLCYIVCNPGISNVVWNVEYFIELCIHFRLLVRLRDKEASILG